MEKDLLLKDYLVSRLISFGKTVDGYCKIYYKTNEDLVDSMLDIDFQDKDVLTVLASGDHVFTSRLLEARKTDAFDFNRLSIYYFYLRIWSMEYREELYPKIMDGDNRWLASLLKMVRPRNEQEQQALDFFRKHIKEDTEMNKLFFDVYSQPDGKTLYRSAAELKDCLNPELDYYPLDLFREFYHSTTYDIILISNILEWARNDPKKLTIAHDNLSRLTKKDGIVVCSSLIDRPKKSMEMEKEIFSDSFTFEKTGSTYTYIKKK